MPIWLQGAFHKRTVQIPIEVVLAALEMQQFMKQLKKSTC